LVRTPVGEDLLEYGRVVTADVCRGDADAQPAVPPRDVLDQVAQRLRKVGGRVPGEQVDQLARTAPGVERAAYGLRGEPVGRGAADARRDGRRRRRPTEPCPAGRPRARPAPPGVPAARWPGSSRRTMR